MKWPRRITQIRHAESGYNQLKGWKELDVEYQHFKNLYDENPPIDSPEFEILRMLADKMNEKYSLKISDERTPLSEAGKATARALGAALVQASFDRPDVVIVSPYLRTKDTWAGIQEGGFTPSIDARISRIFEDGRIREQDHGLASIYNDWRVFHVLNPNQRILYERQGPYWYTYPQGENVENVRERIRSITNTIIREFAGRHVCFITHHLTILSMRANFERWDADRFIEQDTNNKPLNCSVTTYTCDPNLGRNGKLVLEHYNQQFI